MNTPDLALFTTAELVAELMRRTTFLGVVVHAAEELRTAGWLSGDRTFKVHFNDNLDTTAVGRLLDTVAGHIDRDVA